MLFQGMFFIITPGLDLRRVCRADEVQHDGGRFRSCGALIVYCPLCHWVWGGGMLAYGTAHAEAWCGGGALDFAGGTVVHISSGVSALICCLVLGKRLGFRNEPMPPHNLTYTASGRRHAVGRLVRLQRRQRLAADGIAASAFAATHFSAAAGAVAWPVVEWISAASRRCWAPASGAVAGLVCITPAAGFVQPMPALVMGAAAGVIVLLHLLDG